MTARLIYLRARERGVGRRCPSEARSGRAVCDPQTGVATPQMAASSASWSSLRPGRRSARAAMTLSITARAASSSVRPTCCHFS